MMMLYALLFLLLISLRKLSACHNNCNRHGTCTIYGTCDCFNGWHGYDCSLRSCPVGPRVVEVANTTDATHSEATCSGRGMCDTKTGNCACDLGYTGNNCGKTFCFNSCSGHGQCFSLRTAAEAYDGYKFNRTTTYTLWDADVFHGCKCDPGFSGADCSERVCPYGSDPRLHMYPHETATLVCSCAPTCSGKFKLQYMGSAVNPWLYPFSHASDIATAIMNAPTIAGKSNAHSVAPVQAFNSTVNNKLCVNGTTTKTKIYFQQYAQDMPSISFYANLIRGGSLYFETTQIIQCNCLSRGCNGTFRVSFDGEMSSRILTWSNGSQVQNALKAMKTVKSAGITILAGLSSPICVPGAVTNHSIVMHAAAGNMPNIGLWSSVIPVNRPAVYNSINASSVLSLISYDGRSDNVKICNGIGTCDYGTGECKCPYGWGPDPYYGPCGKPIVNSSRWAGVGRCPGVVDAFMDSEGEFADWTGRQSHRTRIYVSYNPSTIQGPKPNWTSSFIEYYETTNDFMAPTADSVRGQFFINLTSNSSAGPILVDQAKNRIFFFDANPVAPFIGFAPIGGIANNYTVWLSLSYQIFGFTMDAHFQRRKLYWTKPGSNNVADGKIYWAYMDAVYPTAYSLTATIGQSMLVDPKGIAVHYTQSKLYWLDKIVVSSSSQQTVLRSCNFDGSGASNVRTYSTVGNHTVSTNYSDLVIDFFHNNTAIFIDSGYPAAIIGTNLDNARFSNSSNTTNFFTYMQPVHLIRTFAQEPMLKPRYLALDGDNAVVFWSDPSLRVVKFSYHVLQPYLTISGTSFQHPGVHGKQNIPYIPIGIALDPGLGTPQFDAYLDCYGNGICNGLAGNWTCTCNAGFHGNCQSRSCPTGPAWFHEPIVDNVAHDVEMECSNMGLCDRKTGQCNCREGYEGSACERMSCQGHSDTAFQCNGRGRCMSLRDMALKHKDANLDSSPLVYGTVPRDPNTWDADSIFGCVPDEYGYYLGVANISSPLVDPLIELTCPFGNNMRYADKVYAQNTVSNYSGIVPEVQQISCYASAGVLYLSFRGQVSPAIPYNSNSYQFQQILQQTVTVGQVHVTSLAGSSTATVCSASTPGAVTMNITFVSEIGNMPLLLPLTTSLVGTAQVTQVQQSQRWGLIECSGRGECNRVTGECECWPGWVSSDGFGNRGTRADCGHSMTY